MESFDGKPIDELLNVEPGEFYTLNVEKILMERWRKEYNQIRPYSSFKYLPPAPVIIMWVTLSYRVIYFWGAL